MAIKKYRKTAQLYNKNGTDTNNGYVADSYLDYNGNPAASSNHTVSEYIDISAYSQITLSGIGTTSASITDVFYNANKEKLSTFYVDIVPKTVNIPSNAKYIRLTVGNARKDTLMLNGGSTALDYEPYGIVPIDWFYREYGTDTDTITSLPKTIIGDGQPISSWSMKGNMTQSGTPTPSNPVYPTEVGEKTANLYFKKITGGSIGADGGIVGNASFDCYVAKVEANQQYIGSGYVYAFYTNEPALGSVSYNGQRVASSALAGFTAPIDGYVAVRHNSDVTDAMLNTGSTALPYEPFGYKIPILSNGVSYPIYLSEPIRKIGDSVDTAPSTGTASRTLGKYEFTGDESFTYESAYSRFSTVFRSMKFEGVRLSHMYCSHYQVIDDGRPIADVPFDTIYSGGSTNAPALFFKTNAYNTETDFKAYLAAQYAAGTPVTVWYVLATAQTESFTAPTIPTSGTAQSFDVDTSLKPSEVSLTYHGWHEHSDTKFTT